jgi:hypothetical protein
MTKTINKHLYPMAAGTVKANIGENLATPEDVSLADFLTALGIKNEVQIVMEVPKTIDSAYTEFYKEVLNTSFPWRLGTGALKGVFVRLGSAANGTAPTIKMRKYSGSAWTDLTNAFLCPTSDNTESDKSSEIITDSSITEGDVLEICVTDIGAGDAANLQVTTVWEV